MHIKPIPALSIRPGEYIEYDGLDLRVIFTRETYYWPNDMVKWPAVEIRAKVTAVRSPSYSVVLGRNFQRGDIYSTIIPSTQSVTAYRPSEI